MKNWSLTNKIIAIVSSILALAMTGIGVYFVERVLWASQLMTFDGQDPDFVDSILSYSVTTPAFLVAVIFFTIFLIAQYSIAAYFIVKGKTKQEKTFGRLNLIIGGLIFSPLYLLYVVIRNKEVKAKEHKVRTGVKVAALAITPVVAIAPIIPLVLYQGLDKPTTRVKNVAFSTKQGAENIIEIFTDGFDPYLTGPLLEADPKLKDFSIMTKFVTSGAETSYSFPTLMAGLEDYNTFKSNDVMGNSSSMTDLYASLFGTTISKHLLNDKSVDYKKPYLINLTGVMDNGSYMSSVSGDPKSMDKDFDAEAHKQNIQDAQVQYVNWGQAKNEVATPFGVAPYGTDQMYYEWLHRKSVINDSATVGTRLLLQEDLAHSPSITGEEGQLTFATGHKDGEDITKTRAAKALKHNFDRLVDDLKALKDANGSVYDNSLILIYGDHSNHANPLPHPGNGVNSEKYHSLAMVKYPHEENTTSSLPTKFEHPFYGPYINKLIESYEASKATTAQKSLNDFYQAHQENFKDDKPLLGFYGNEGIVNHFDASGKLVGTAYNFPHNHPTSSDGFIMYDAYKAWDADASVRNNDLISDFAWKGGI